MVNLILKDIDEIPSTSQTIHNQPAKEKLPIIRDEVFFPDYSEFGYIPQETTINEYDLIIIINFGLLSVSANRLLALNYGFLKNSESIDDGGFNDLIFILNEDKGWDNKIEIDLLARKRFGIELNLNYKVNFHTEDFLLHAKEKLLEIKSNFDNYASDIIEGINWDRNAWRDLRD